MESLTKSVIKQQKASFLNIDTAFGATVGFLVGGPIGAAVGAAIGSYFGKKSQEKAIENGTPPKEPSFLNKGTLIGAVAGYSLLTPVVAVGAVLVGGSIMATATAVTVAAVGGAIIGGLTGSKLRENDLKDDLKEYQNVAKLAADIKNKAPEKSVEPERKYQVAPADWQVAQARFKDGTESYARKIDNERNQDNGVNGPAV